MHCCNNDCCAAGAGSLRGRTREALGYVATRIYNGDSRENDCGCGCGCNCGCDCGCGCN